MCVCVCVCVCVCAGAHFLHEKEEYKIAETALAFVCIHTGYLKDRGEVGVREVFAQGDIDIAAKDVGKHTKFPPGFMLEVLLEEMVPEEHVKEHVSNPTQQQGSESARRSTGGLLGAFLFGRRGGGGGDHPSGPRGCGGGSVAQEFGARGWGWVATRAVW